MKNYIVPTAIQSLSMSSQIAKAHGLSAFKTKFFTKPNSFGEADPEDDIVALPSARSSNDSSGNIGNLTETNYMLNTLVYDAVTFMGINGGDIYYYDLVSGQPIPVPKMQIPIALCSVTKNIKVVTSDIAGRNGTIKQYINVGDYDIVIRGVFTTGISDKYPKDAMTHLQKITSASSEVKVASNFLQLFGISYLVFTKCEFEQAEDEGRDIQKFTLTCVSETPFAIKLTQLDSTTSTSFTSTNPTK